MEVLAVVFLWLRDVAVGSEEVMEGVDDGEGSRFGLEFTARSPCCTVDGRPGLESVYKERYFGCVEACRLSDHLLKTRSWASFSYLAGEYGKSDDGACNGFCDKGVSAYNPASHSILMMFLPYHRIHLLNHWF